MKRLKFNKASCIGCQLCSQVCSAYKEGEYIPSKARIAIETYYDKGTLKYADHYCMVKNLPANAGDLDSIPGSGRSPGEGNGNPLQYSCLENPMDR